MFSAVIKFFKSFTVEPLVFFFVFAEYLVLGSELQTNLMMWKVCNIELGLNETICDNLDLEENDEYETIVQRRVNDFMMISQWIGAVPSIFFSLFVGAISDDFGRKPIIVFPVIGAVLTSISDIVNSIWIRTLPLEFFYLQNLYFFFGGKAVYYLGTYGYGATIASHNNRASLLARFDGIEQLGILLGTFLSPIFFNLMGYTPLFCIRTAAHCCGLSYLLIFVKEPIQKKISSGDKSENSRSTFFLAKVGYFLVDFVYKPFLQVMKTVLRPRINKLQYLIWIMFMVYVLYLCNSQFQVGSKYLYMLKVLEDFDGTDYAFYNVYIKILSTFCLMVIVPFLRAKLQLHEAILMTMIAFCNSLGLLLFGFARVLWQFYLCETVMFVCQCQFSMTRALFTKCISKDEIGKVYSAIAFFVALTPIAANPMFRRLYDSTIDTFPAAIVLLDSALATLCTMLCFFLFTQRRKMLVNRKGMEIDHSKKIKNDEQASDVDCQTYL